MSKILKDEIGYYLSCMIPFNAIYFSRTLREDVNTSICFLQSSQIILMIFGIISTLQILQKDDSVKNAHTIGKTVKAINIEDLTNRNHFAFLLMILAGISLPIWNNFYSLIIYIVVLALFGSVYIEKRIIYINPILMLKQYKIYRCVNENKEHGENRTYIFIVKDSELKEGQEITYENIPDNIIRLNQKIS